MFVKCDPIKRYKWISFDMGECLPASIVHPSPTFVPPSYASSETGGTSN